MNTLVVIIALVIGVVVGAVAGYLFGRQSVARSEALRAEENATQIIGLSAAKSALAKEVELLQNQLEDEKQRAETDACRLKEEFRAQQAEQEQRFKDAEAARRAEFKLQLEQQLELVKSQLKQQTEQSNRESITEIMRP